MERDWGGFQKSLMFCIKPRVFEEDSLFVHNCSSGWYDSRIAEITQQDVKGFTWNNCREERFCHSNDHAVQLGSDIFSRNPLKKNFSCEKCLDFAQDACIWENTVILPLPHAKAFLCHECKWKTLKHIVPYEIICIWKICTCFRFLGRSSSTVTLLIRHNTLKGPKHSTPVFGWVVLPSVFLLIDRIPRFNVPRKGSLFIS